MKALGDLILAGGFMVAVFLGLIKIGARLLGSG